MARGKAWERTKPLHTPMRAIGEGTIKRYPISTSSTLPRCIVGGGKGEGTWTALMFSGTWHVGAYMRVLW